MAEASLDSKDNCIGKASLKEEEHSIGLARRNHMQFQKQNTYFLWVQASHNYYSPPQKKSLYPSLIQPVELTRTTFKNILVQILTSCSVFFFQGPTAYQIKIMF